MRAPLRFIPAVAAMIALHQAAAQTYIPVADAPQAPQREFRAAWVATVYNLDWPSSSGLSASAQQAEMIAILNKLQDLNMNAVIFQVRPQSDAVYRSRIEPWAPYLTGKMGGDPGYDPLSFVIAEAHKRGIEVHAWFNPFRALTSSKNGASSGHVTNKHPEWIRRYGPSSIVDPGEPKARDYVISVIMDVVNRYDIDGVHLDDYFYPYKLKGAEFPDSSTYGKYGGGAGRTEWRRENINQFIRRLYTSIKSAKSGAKFGISPFGIWRPGVPSTIEAGVDAYEDLAADGPKWLANGWVDYLSPQLYWSIEPAQQSFSTLLGWWISKSTAGRPIWPGIATERIGKNRPASEIINQIQICRRSSRSDGQLHWQMKALMRNQGGIAKLLKETVYSRKAAVPGGSNVTYAPAIEVRDSVLHVSVPKNISPKFLVVQKQIDGVWSDVEFADGATDRLPLAEMPDAICVRVQDSANDLSLPAVLKREQ